MKFKVTAHIIDQNKRPVKELVNRTQCTVKACHWMVIDAIAHHDDQPKGSFAVAWTIEPINPHTEQPEGLVGKGTIELTKRPEFKAPAKEDKKDGK